MPARRQTEARAPAAQSPASAHRRLRITPAYTAWLEEALDEVNAKLPPLRSFVIPGGSPAAAHLHVCRTVCRRAERRALAVEDANPEVVRYLNRLSDLLFVLARAANQGPATVGAPVGSRSARARRPGALATDLVRASPRAGRGPHPRVAPASGPRLVPRAAQRGHGQRDAQGGEQIAAEHVAGHMPREDQQRTADRDRDRAAERSDQRTQAVGSDEQRAQHERHRRGRMAARPRGRADPLPADAVVGVREQRLEHLGETRRGGQHHRDRERHPRAARSSATATSSSAQTV